MREKKKTTQREERASHQNRHGDRLPLGLHHQALPDRQARTNKGEHMKVTIPASVEEATEQLNGIHSLLTAREWERAAIVAAFAKEGQAGRPTKSASAGRLLTPVQFAALGIHGLRSKDTVRRYVRAWASTGLPRPVSGEDVDLPTIDFPAWSPNGSAPSRVLSRLDLMTPEELEAHEKQRAEWDAETPEWENPITPMRKTAEAMGTLVAIEHAFDAAMLAMDDIQTEFDKDVAVSALVTIKNKLEMLYTMVVSETPNDVSSLIN